MSTFRTVVPELVFFESGSSAPWGGNYPMISFNPSTGRLSVSREAAAR